MTVFNELELFIDTIANILNGEYEMCLTSNCAMIEYNNKHGDNDYISPHLLKDNAMNGQYLFEQKNNLFEMDYQLQQVLLIYFQIHILSVAQKIGNNDLRFQFKYKYQLLSIKAATGKSDLAIRKI